MNLHPASVMNAQILARLEAAPPVAAKVVTVAEPAPPVVPAGLARIIRPQAASRWAMPSVAQVTPQYIESVLRSALTGDQVRQWELFDLMLDTWPELLACQQELVEGVLALNPVFEAYAEEDEEPTDSARERMRVVSAALRGMRPRVERDENGLDDTRKDLADGWFRGVVTLETEWHVFNAGKLGAICGPRATFWVHPSQTGWSTAGFFGLRTDAAGSSHGVAGITEFPPHKFLVGIHKAKSGSPLGGALLRALAWWWCAANFASDWLLNLAQIFGLPMRWANYDPNASPATVDAVCTMLQNMGSAGWAAFPAGTNLELKEAGKSGDSSPQGELLDRADRYARMLLLGQTMSGSQSASKGGGKAFGEVESDVKEQRIAACAKYVAAVFNNQLIPSILELNFGNADEAPTVCFASEEEDDLQQGATIINTLVSAGFGPHMPVSYIQRRFNIPAPAEGEPTLEAPKADPAADPARKPKPGAKKPGKEIEDEPARAKDGGEPGGELGDALLEAAAGQRPFSRDVNHLRAIAAITDDAAFAERLAEFAKTL